MNLRFFKRHRPAQEGAVSWVAALSPEQRRVLKFNLKSVLERMAALFDGNYPGDDGRPSRSR